MRLKDRVALVTGIAMGIGKSIAELFAEEGASIIGVDLQADKGDKVAQQLRARGSSCQFRSGDVTSEEFVREVVRDGIHAFGKIDALINVVGIASEAEIDKLELAEWDRTIRVNLTSMYLLAKHVLPNMLGNHYGSIVHISSVQALIGFPAFPHYAASKGAIISLTRQMASEYGSQGVRVNCIAPGTVLTPMTENVFERSPNPAKIRSTLENRHPIGRLGVPLDVAYGALYLASDESSFVTGHCLVIDGGFSISAHLK